MLVWDESLSTGNSSIDQQHQRLFNFVNNLEEEVRATPQAPVNKERLDFLQTYVQVHFASEELCMFRNACAVATQNKLAHHAFLQRVEELTASPQEVLASELLEFLQRWIKGHIMAVDRRMTECVEESAPVLS